MRHRSIQPLPEATLIVSLLKTNRYISNYIQRTQIYTNTRLVYLPHFCCHIRTVQKQRNLQPQLDLRIHTEAPSCKFPMVDGRRSTLLHRPMLQSSWWLAPFVSSPAHLPLCLVHNELEDGNPWPVMKEEEAGEGCFCVCSSASHRHELFTWSSRPVQATLDKLRGPRGLCDQLTGQEGSLWTYVTLLIIKFVDL